MRHCKNVHAVHAKSWGGTNVAVCLVSLAVGKEWVNSRFGIVDGGLDVLARRAAAEFALVQRDYLFKKGSGSHMT
jgi:hypothetical protein